MINFFFQVVNALAGHAYFESSGTSFAAPYATAVSAHVLVAMEAMIYNEAKNSGKTEEQARELGNIKP